MTLTSSGAISNSGSKEFTNVNGTIAKQNYNRATESASIYEQLMKINGIKPIPYNRYPKFNPQSADSILANIKTCKN